MDVMLESLRVLEAESTKGAAELLSPHMGRRLRNAEDWAGEIRKFLERGKSSTLDLARTVHNAKSSLHYGEWSELWAKHRMPFSKSKADAFALIGRRFGGLDSQTFGNLPAGWSILHQLARLQPGDLDTLFNEGKIHPALKLAEAKGLVARFNGNTDANSSRSSVKQRLRHFQHFVRGSSGEWTPTQRDMVRAELCQLALELKDQNDSRPAVEFHITGRNSLAAGSSNN